MAKLNECLTVGEAAKLLGVSNDTQRRCYRADGLFANLIKGTKCECLDGFHALRHSFMSILASQRKTWDLIAGCVGHLDRRTTQRYVHFVPKEKRETINSIAFEF